MGQECCVTSLLPGEAEAGCPLDEFWGMNLKEQGRVTVSTLAFVLEGRPILSCPPPARRRRGGATRAF